MSKVKTIPIYFLILGLLFTSVSGCVGIGTGSRQGETPTGANEQNEAGDLSSSEEVIEDETNSCQNFSSLQGIISNHQSQIAPLLQPEQLSADFYQKASSKITSFEQDYQRFKSQCPEVTARKEFQDFDDKIIKSINLNKYIFGLLIKGNIQQAQTKLSEIKFGGQALYQFSEEEQQQGKPDGEDGQGTRVAAQKLLGSLTKNLRESSSQISNLVDVGSEEETSAEETKSPNPEVSTVTQATGSDNAGDEEGAEKVSTFWDINFLDLLLSIIGLVGLVFLVLLWKSKSNSLTIQSDFNDTNNKKIVKEVLNKARDFSKILANIDTKIQVIQKDKNSNLDNEKIENFINELSSVRKSANELIISSLSQINSSKYTTESSHDITDSISDINQEIQSIKSLVETYNSSVLDNQKLDQLSQSFNQISNSFKDVSDNLNLLQASIPKKEVLETEISKIQNLLNSLAEKQNLGKTVNSSFEQRQKCIELEQQLKQNYQTNINLQNRIRELEEQLDEQKQYLSFISQDEEREKENLQFKNKISELESELQELKNKSEKDRQEFNSGRQILEKEKSDLEQKILQLQKQVTELTSKAKSSKSQHLPDDIFTLVTVYQKNPELLLSQSSDKFHIEEVSEMEESATKRYDGNSSDVILEKSIPNQGEFWIVSIPGMGASYLFPKKNQISKSQKITAKALFAGYKSGNTDKFILNKPAKVSHIVSSGKWRLEEKGELNYEI
ncbi:MAG: hypothetical protein QNJ55_32020 [Xenococcus sp. MO_188.B8]|nr:hypothetical protein [Xenococcus sp. MO_188.B8]